jgi:hypothetical protein
MVVKIGTSQMIPNSYESFARQYLPVRLIGMFFADIECE